MVLTGLHWDQAQGLFIQQPLFLVGLVGLPHLFLVYPRWGVFWIFLYGSLLVPHALHPGLYGGWSFYGRYNWSFCALWIIPASIPLGHMIQRDNQFRLAGILGLAIGYQVCLSPNWLGDHWMIMADSLLYAPGFSVKWARRLLPRFMEVDGVLFHLPNYLAGVLTLTLLYSGYRYFLKAGRQGRSFST